MKFRKAADAGNLKLKKEMLESSLAGQVLLVEVILQIEGPFGFHD